MDNREEKMNRGNLGIIDEKYQIGSLFWNLEKSKTSHLNWNGGSNNLKELLVIL